MKLESVLKSHLEGKNSLDEFISAFEKMCEEPVVCAEEMLLFETGNYSFGNENNEKEFYFSLVRQYELPGMDEFIQVRLDIIYPKISFFTLRRESFWSDSDPNNDYKKFFEKVRESKAYLYLSIKNSSPIRIEVREEET